MLTIRGADFYGIRFYDDDHKVLNTDEEFITVESSSEATWTDE